MEEEGYKPTNVDYRSYAEALESVNSLYERLYLSKALRDGCNECPLIEEVSKLDSLTRDLIQESIEKDLGYFMPVQKVEVES